MGPRVPDHYMTDRDLTPWQGVRTATPMNGDMSHWIFLCGVFSVPGGCRSPTLHHWGWWGTGSGEMVLNVLLTAGGLALLWSVPDRPWLGHHGCPLSAWLWRVSESSWRQDMETLSVLLVLREWGGGVQRWPVDSPHKWSVMYTICVSSVF